MGTIFLGKAEIVAELSERQILKIMTRDPTYMSFFIRSSETKLCHDSSMWKKFKCSETSLWNMKERYIASFCLWWTFSVDFNGWNHLKAKNHLKLSCTLIAFIVFMALQIIYRVTEAKTFKKKLKTVIRSGGLNKFSVELTTHGHKEK